MESCIASKHSVKNLPPEERPRERLARFGSAALSTVELLAILLGSGSKGESVLTLAQKLLSSWGSLSNMAKAPLEELQKMRGMGVAKAIQLKAALALALRLEAEKEEGRPLLNTPKAVFRYVKPFYLGATKEQLSLICLDAKGHVTHFEMLSVGTLNQTLIHPREVFSPAIQKQAARILLVHNHPSGDPTPSLEDIEQTKRLIQVGKIMGIALDDHLVITQNSYVSIRDVLIRNNKNYLL